MLKYRSKGNNSIQYSYSITSLAVSDSAELGTGKLKSLEWQECDCFILGIVHT